MMKNLCCLVVLIATFNIEFVSGQEFDRTVPSGLSFTEASGVAVDPATGNIYVTTVCQILILDPSGSYLSRIGSCGADNLQFFRPQGIVLQVDKILVVDSGNARIQILDRNGN